MQKGLTEELGQGKLEDWKAGGEQTREQRNRTTWQSPTLPSAIPGRPLRPVPGCPVRGSPAPGRCRWERRTGTHPAGAWAVDHPARGRWPGRVVLTEDCTAGSDRRPGIRLRGALPCAARLQPPPPRSSHTVALGSTGRGAEPGWGRAGGGGAGPEPPGAAAEGAGRGLRAGGSSSGSAAGSRPTPPRAGPPRCPGPATRSLWGVEVDRSARALGNEPEGRGRNAACKSDWPVTVEASLSDTPVQHCHWSQVATAADILWTCLTLNCSPVPDAINSSPRHGPPLNSLQREEKNKLTEKQL
ncbi:uncharacterized protein LOC141577578 [Camelus bactrianus]|uniref:Uncharacterized protein LOC141577578 n=1 Tax=Camelus bactrianus TaxID=9837 RepID=A0AC58QAH0_CAMBA